MTVAFLAFLVIIVVSTIVVILLDASNVRQKRHRQQRRADSKAAIKRQWDDEFAQIERKQNQR